MIRNQKNFYKLIILYILLALFIKTNAKTIKNSDIQAKRSFRSVFIDNGIEDFDDETKPDRQIEMLLEDITSLKQNSERKAEGEILNYVDVTEYKTEEIDRSVEIATKSSINGVNDGGINGVNDGGINGVNDGGINGVNNGGVDGIQIVFTETTSRGPLRRIDLDENDTREGICKTLMRDTKHIEVTTRGLKESFTPHHIFNYSKCCFNNSVECKRPWYFTPVIPYYETKREWKEVDACCEGYVRDKRRPYDDQGRILCAPVCRKTCVKSTCTAPNQCTCLPGYIRAEGNETACIPSCKKNCGGKSRGECVAPETCLCKRGFKYHKGKLNTCVSYCPKGCFNSACIGPSTCRCWPGYKPDENNRNRCVSVCKGCAHGNCIAPNTCVCHKGYHLEDGNCFPKCNHFCGYNGTCINTGTTIKCVCNPAYTFDARIQECVPYCENCDTKGVCVRPNKCNCFPGFIPTKEGGCVFPCSFECGLGRCVGKDKCSCSKGYIFNRTAEGSKCVPYCPGCDLGECIAPNNCQCPRGYVYHTPKEGEDRSLRCIRTVKEFRYYDSKVCKFIYNERKRQREIAIIKKKRRRAKLKWEEERRKRKRLYETIMRKKQEEQRKHSAKARRRKDKLERTVEKRNQKRLDREKNHDEIIKKMYAEYRRKTEQKSTVTWKNFARIGLASMWFGPFGVVFW